MAKSIISSGLKTPKPSHKSFSFGSLSLLGWIQYFAESKSWQAKISVGKKNLVLV